MDENLYKKISNALDDVLDLKGIIVHYNGQYIDMTKADTSLIIDVALDSTTISGSPIVKLYYADKFKKDYNIKFVISGKIFSDKTSLSASSSFNSRISRSTSNS